MPIIDRTEIYSENIKTIYVKLVTIKSVNNDVELYLNDSGEVITFKGKEYMPVAFKMNEPNKSSIEEGNATLSIIGVTNDYIEMIQTAKGEIIITSSVVALGDLSDYVLNPVEYTVESISIKSADASINVSIKTGGALNFFISSKTYGISNFPALNG